MNVHECSWTSTLPIYFWLIFELKTKLNQLFFLLDCTCRWSVEPSQMGNRKDVFSSCIFMKIAEYSGHFSWIFPENHHVNWRNKTRIFLLGNGDERLETFILYKINGLKRFQNHVHSPKTVELKFLIEFRLIQHSFRYWER
jgi:hypothetical protein